MKTSSKLYPIQLNEKDLAGVLRLRTSVSRICSKAFLEKRAKQEGKKAEPILLQDVLELAISFEKSLEEADNFWREIDYLAKISYSGE